MIKTLMRTAANGSNLKEKVVHNPNPRPSFFPPPAPGRPLGRSSAGRQTKPPGESVSREGNALHKRKSASGPEAPWTPSPCIPTPSAYALQAGRRAGQGQLRAARGGGTATPAPGESSTSCGKGARVKHTSRPSAQLGSSAVRARRETLAQARRETPGVVRQAVRL